MNQLQACELDILKAVIDIIENNELRYFACAGTLIGAVRHKGFIPWDDDIDIIMPRKDYEHFRTEIYKQLPNHLVKIDYDDTKQYAFLFTKVYDKRTTYIGSYCQNYPNWYTGVFIDIFPLDGVPSNPKERINHINKLYVYKKLNGLLRFARGESPIKNIIKIPISSLLCSIFNFKYFTNKILNFMMSCDYDSSEYVFATGIYEKKLKDRVIWRREWFEPVEGNFEGIKIKIPRYYDEVLKCSYGNYMQLPPPEERISHPVIVCDLGTPVQYYKNHPEKVFAHAQKIFTKL